MKIHHDGPTSLYKVEAIEAASISEGEVKPRGAMLAVSPFFSGSANTAAWSIPSSVRGFRDGGDASRLVQCGHDQPQFAITLVCWSEVLASVCDRLASVGSRLNASRFGKR